MPVSLRGLRQNPMLIAAILIIAVLITSFISGVFGMAGGIILMWVLGSLMPVRDAFVVHGASQFFSNATRVWFLRRYIIWSIVAFYAIGWLLAIVGFYLINYFPNKGVVFIILGILPWIGFALPRHIQPDIKKPGMAILCGLLVTAFQLLAGASGPILDYFYLSAKLTRHEIVGTKAFTQGIGHLAKLIYYGLVVSALVEEELTFSAWWLLALLPLVWIGTRIGKEFLDRMSDYHFLNIARWLTRTLGILLALQGVLVLLA